MRVQLKHFGFFLARDFERSCGYKLMLGLFGRNYLRPYDSLYRLHIQLHFSWILGFRHWIETYPAWMEEPTALIEYAYSTAVHDYRYRNRIAPREAAEYDVLTRFRHYLGMPKAAT